MAVGGTPYSGVNVGGICGDADRRAIDWSVSRGILSLVVGKVDHDIIASNVGDWNKNSHFAIQQQITYSFFSGHVQ